MHRPIRLAIFILALFTAITPVLAQDDETVEVESIHPFLNTKYQLALGGFWPNKDVRVRADGTIPGEEIDFEEDLGYSESDNSFAILFRWRFGRKWDFQAQGFDLDSSSQFVLEDDIEFDGLTFLEGSFAKSGIELQVARVFFGRKFSEGPRHEFGMGLGFHWLEISAFIEGDVQTDMGGTEFQRADASADFPMPNLGAWYYYAFNEKWLLNIRTDWLDVSVDKYSGGLWNGLIGVQWNPSERWGLSLAYNSFALDGSIDDSDWRGKIDYEAHGPLFTVSYAWGSRKR